MSSFLRTGIQISKRDFFVIIIFFFAFFEAYYFLITNFLEQVIPSSLDIVMLQGILYFFTCIILLFGSFFIQKFSKLKIIYFCSVLNCIFSLLFLINFFEAFWLLLIFFLVLFMSLAMLTTLCVFGNLTSPEERGRIGGIIGLFVFLLFFVVNFSIAPNLEFYGSVLLTFSLSFLPFIALLFKNFRIKIIPIKKMPENYYERRVFFLYFIPWIIFSLINATLATNTSNFIIQSISDSLLFTLESLQVLGVLIGVLLGGFVADILGRRFSLVFGLTFFGFSTALIGLFQTEIVYLIVYGASGLTWGILFVLYIFVVWGDLSNENNRIKIYSIGLISYFLSLGVGSFVALSMEIIPSAFLSVLIIFILNIPIIFAPELLPSYILERNRLRRHMGAVKKFKNKNQG
ncbi:MAG: hypothetical protein AC479_01730 [miscellaneous Crenarchaeota group-6 archaeon AD8-1]|nr:MAG: hypothetical protein AC479_01730 [miscellaneous Crenarchaeota group-6 archaeon AD8-1]